MSTIHMHETIFHDRPLPHSNQHHLAEEKVIHNTNINSIDLPSVPQDSSDDHDNDEHSVQSNDQNFLGSFSLDGDVEHKENSDRYCIPGAEQVFGTPDDFGSQLAHSDFGQHDTFQPTVFLHQYTAHNQVAHLLPSHLHQISYQSLSLPQALHHSDSESQFHQSMLGLPQQYSLEHHAMPEESRVYHQTQNKPAPSHHFTLGQLFPSKMSARLNVSRVLEQEGKTMLIDKKFCGSRQVRYLCKQPKDLTCKGLSTLAAELGVQPAKGSCDYRMQFTMQSTGYWKITRMNPFHNSTCAGFRSMPEPSKVRRARRGISRDSNKPLPKPRVRKSRAKRYIIEAAKARAAGLDPPFVPAAIPKRPRSLNSPPLLAPDVDPHAYAQALAAVAAVADSARQIPDSQSLEYRKVSIEAGDLLMHGKSHHDSTDSLADSLLLDFVSKAELGKDNQPLREIDIHHEECNHELLMSSTRQNCCKGNSKNEKNMMEILDGLSESSIAV